MGQRSLAYGTLASISPAGTAFTFLTHHTHSINCIQAVHIERCSRSSTPKSYFSLGSTKPKLDQTNDEPRSRPVSHVPLDLQSTLGMAPTEALAWSSNGPSSSGVLSPQDFGKAASRRPRSKGRVELNSPKTAQPRPRTLPKVTATLESGPLVQEPLPVPSSVRVAAWCSTAGPSSPSLDTDFAPARTAQCTRRLSSDTFGRRDSDCKDSPCPSRRLEDEISVDMRQSMSASTYESEHEEHGSSCEQSSAAGDYRASETTSATPQTVAWRKEADAEWEARLNRNFRPSSQHPSPRASLLNTANIVYEKGSSPKGTTSASTLPAPLFKIHNPFFDRTATKEMKVTGSAGVLGSSSSHFAAHDHWRRSLPHNSDSIANQGETWSVWKTVGEGHRRSLGSSCKGHPDAFDPTASRNNSMVSSTSSSSRIALTHRTSSTNFLAGLIGRELSSNPANSPEAGGIASGPSVPKGDLKQLLRRSARLSRPSSTELLGQLGKYSSADRSEGKGSPLKTAFPLPHDSPTTAMTSTMPARAKRRMSMPSRQRHSVSAPSNGMVMSFGGEHASSGHPTGRRDRAPSVHRYSPGPSPSSLTAALPIAAAASVDVSDSSRHVCGSNEKQRARTRAHTADSLSTTEGRPGNHQTDSRAKQHWHTHSELPTLSNGLPLGGNESSSSHRPRSRSDTEVHHSDMLTSAYTLSPPSVLRRVFVPPVQMDPHDEEQHTCSEASADEGTGEVKQTVDSNVDDLLQERERVSKTSNTPHSPSPVVPIRPTPSGPVMAPSRSASREKEEATLMNRTSSSRSSRTMASASALLSPTKLLRRLASRDGLSGSGRGRFPPLDGDFSGGVSPTKQHRASKPEEKTSTKRSLAGSTSADCAAHKSPPVALSRPKTAPTESEEIPRSRRPSLLWTGHSTPVLPGDASPQQAIVDATPSLGKMPTDFESQIDQGPLQGQRIAPSSLGLFTVPSHNTGPLSDVPALDSTSSSDSVSLDCSPYSTGSSGLPSPFSPTNETSISQPARAAEAEATDEGVRSSSPLYRPPTQTQSLYQRRRSATLPAATGVGSTKPLSLFFDSDRKETNEVIAGMAGFYITGPPLEIDATLSPSSDGPAVSPCPISAQSLPSSLQDVFPGSSPSRQGLQAATPSRPPRRKVAGSLSPSYFGPAGVTSSGHPALTPPPPADAGSVILGPAPAKARQGWEHQGHLSGRGAIRSASPGKNPSTTRARIEKFFGGGMSTGKGVDRGTLAP